MRRLLLAATLLVAPLFAPAAARADSPQHLVDSATLSLEDIMGGSPGTQAQQFLEKARAVVVCPSIFRGAFFIGGACRHGPSRASRLGSPVCHGMAPRP